MYEKNNCKIGIQVLERQYFKWSWRTAGFSNTNILPKESLHRNQRFRLTLLVLTVHNSHWCRQVWHDPVYNLLQGWDSLHQQQLITFRKILISRHCRYLENHKPQNFFVVTLMVLRAGPLKRISPWNTGRVITCPNWDVLANLSCSCFPGSPEESVRQHTLISTCEGHH